MAAPFQFRAVSGVRLAFNFPLRQNPSRAPLFDATVQGVEEAVVNAMVAARTMTGADYWTVSALPHDQLREVLRRHNMLTDGKSK